LSIGQSGSSRTLTPSDIRGDLSAHSLIIRRANYDHSPRTSMEVHGLIEGSVMIDPPWSEDAWETGHLFDPWVLGAPVMLDFMND
jgi:2-hydroxy-6-oxonona-2,4-dienedioate hydrolase